MCGNNVTRKYWLIADRPNEAKKCGLFSPLVQILWGGGGGGGGGGGHAPPLPTPLVNPDPILGKFSQGQISSSLESIKKNVAHGQWCYPGPGDQIQKCKNKLALHKARKRKRQNNLRVF